MTNEAFHPIPSNLDPAVARYDYVIPATAPWSGIVHKGETLRIVDLEGCQAVDTLFYSAAAFSDCYSAQDTIALQRHAYVSVDTAIVSNAGTVLARVTADTCGRHDTSAGACSCEANTVRFGHHTRYMHACRENFTLELSKYGMSKRDIVGNLNFFMNVPILEDGRLAIVDGVSNAGDYIELRAEMDILAVISNCPQVNNPCNGFNPTPVRVLIWNGAEA